MADPVFLALLWLFTIFHILLCGFTPILQCADLQLLDVLENPPSNTVESAMDNPFFAMAYSCPSISLLNGAANLHMTRTLMAAPLAEVKTFFFMANTVVACMAKSCCDIGIGFECSITKNHAAHL